MSTANRGDLSSSLEEFPKDGDSNLFTLLQLLNELSDKYNVMDILDPLKKVTTELGSQERYQKLKVGHLNDAYSGEFVAGVVEPLIWLLNKSCYLNEQADAVELHLNILLKLVTGSLLLGYNKNGIQPVNPMLRNLLEWYPNIMGRYEQADILAIKILLFVLVSEKLHLEHDIQHECLGYLIKFAFDSSLTSVVQLACTALLECTKHYTKCAAGCLGEFLSHLLERLHHQVMPIVSKLETQKPLANENSNALVKSSKKDFLFRKKPVALMATGSSESCTTNEKTVLSFGLEVLVEIFSPSNVDQECVDMVRQHLTVILICVFYCDDEIVSQALKLIALTLKNAKATMKHELKILLSTLVLYFNMELCRIESKERILGFFVEILKQPEACLEIYMNYDCDPDASFDVLNNMLMILSDVNIESSSLLVHNIVGICSFIQSVDIWNNTRATSNSGSPDESPIQRNAQSIEFERMKGLKGQLETGFAIFSKNGPKGMDFFVQEGIVSPKHEEIAAFIFENIQYLSRTQLGLYFSAANNTAVLQSFLQFALDDTGELIVALRKVFEFFKLPPESQQIDRIIDSFAKVFCAKCDSSGQWNIDSAYIVAYAIIMLNTDLHNANVCHKIGKDDFLKNSQFIVEKYNIERDLLVKIYEDVLNNPILYCQSREGAKLQKTSSFTLRSRFENDSLTSLQQLLERARTLVETEKKSTGNQIFYYATHEENFYDLMFASFGCFLNSIKILVQVTENVDQVQLLFKTLLTLSNLAVKMGLLDQFQQTVRANNSFLFDSVDGRQRSVVKLRSILAVKNMLLVAQTNGNYMFSLWGDFFKSLKMADSLDLFTDTFTMDYCPLINFLDKFISSTRELDEKNIFSLVQCLCDASWDEVMTCNGTFFLERLLEVAHYNALRVKYEWYKIWMVMNDFFVRIIRENLPTNVFKFIIDSLKQLTFKYLERCTVSQEKIMPQHDVLHTFYELLEYTEKTELIELILQCLHQIVGNYGGILQHRWVNVLKCAELGLLKASSIIDSSVSAIWKVYGQEHLSLDSSEKCIQSFKNIFIALLQTSHNSKQINWYIEIYRLNLDKFLHRNPLDSRFEILLCGIREACNCPDLEVRSLALNILFTLFNYELQGSSSYFSLFETYFYSLFDLLWYDDLGTAFTDLQRTRNQRCVQSNNCTTQNKELPAIGLKFTNMDEVEEFTKTTLISAYKYFCLLVSSGTRHSKDDRLLQKAFELTQQSLFYPDVWIIKMGLYCLKEIVNEISELSNVNSRLTTGSCSSDIFSSYSDKLLLILVSFHGEQSNYAMFSELLMEIRTKLLCILGPAQIFSFIKQLQSDCFIEFQWEISKALTQEGNLDQPLAEFIDKLIVRCFQLDTQFNMANQILQDFSTPSPFLNNYHDFSAVDKALIQFIQNPNIVWERHNKFVANYLSFRLQYDAYIT